MTRVFYPGRPNHPDHELAKRLLGGGFGNMLCFELDGGRASVNRLLRHSGIPFSPSLGNATTTLSHPATTSHRYVSPAERKRQGISDGLVRLSVGVEDAALTQEQIRPRTCLIAASAQVCSSAFRRRTRQSKNRLKAELRTRASREQRKYEQCNWNIG